MTFLADFIVPVISALIAMGIVVFEAQNSAFRNAEEEKLGRYPMSYVAVAVLATVIMTWLRTSIAPSPWVLGVIAGSMTAAAWADARVWEIPNMAPVCILVAALVDAIVQHQLLEWLVGIVAVGILLTVAAKVRLLKGGDIKLVLALGAAFGGLVGVAALMVGILAFTAIHVWRQSQSPVPLTTKLPWTPFLVIGTAAAFAVCISPLADFLVIARP